MTDDLTPPVRPLTKRQAQQLTERIRISVQQVHMLILEAREGEAWKPMGYANWDQYVAGEFGMTSRNAGFLMQRARVEKAIAAADPTGSALPVTVSQRDAAAIGRDPDALPAIEAAVADGADPKEAVKEALARPSAAETPVAAPPSEFGPARALLEAMTVTPSEFARRASVPTIETFDEWWKKVRATALMGKVEQERQAQTAPPRITPASSLPPIRPRREAPKVSAKDCLHPVNVRIGKSCMECGATVAAR